MFGENNYNVFFIQIDASSFAEFEISEFEISIVDCITLVVIGRKHATDDNIDHVIKVEHVSNFV